MQFLLPCFIFFSFFYKNTSLVPKAQVTPISITYHYEVAINKTDSAMGSVVMPINISFDLQLIANGRYYYVTPSMGDMTVFGRGVPTHATEEDVFIDTHLKRIYFLEKQTYSPYFESKEVAQRINDSSYTVTSSRGDTLKVKTASNYKSYIKPFPGFPVLPHGVTEVTKQNSKTTLTDLHATTFDYASVVEKVKKFSYDSTIYHFPYQ